MMRLACARRPRGDAGSAALELVVLAPVLLVLLALVIAAGRTSIAKSSIDAAAGTRPGRHRWRSARRPLSRRASPAPGRRWRTTGWTASREGRRGHRRPERWLRPPAGTPATCRPPSGARCRCRTCSSGAARSAHDDGYLLQPARCLPGAVTRCAVTTVSQPARHRGPAAAASSPRRRRMREQEDTAGTVPPDGERGALSLMIVVLFVALIALAGIVVDGGAKLAAYENAEALAQEAARAGRERGHVQRLRLRLVRGESGAGRLGRGQLPELGGLRQLQRVDDRQSRHRGERDDHRTHEVPVPDRRAVVYLHPLGHGNLVTGVTGGT